MSEFFFLKTKATTLSDQSTQKQTKAHDMISLIIRVLKRITISLEFPQNWSGFKNSALSNCTENHLIRTTAHNRLNEMFCAPHNKIQHQENFKFYIRTVDFMVDAPNSPWPRNTVD